MPEKDLRIQTTPEKLSQAVTMEGVIRVFTVLCSGPLLDLGNLLAVRPCEIRATHERLWHAP